MDPLTFNRKDTAAKLGHSTDLVDDLDRRGHLKRLTAYGGVRYGLKNIENVAGFNVNLKTVREIELEKRLKEKDQRIEELIRFILANGMGDFSSGAGGMHIEAKCTGYSR